eukprot:TRINITY_DN2676_c0_g1_i1.p1 TRINITY_DN2676_c0_g1~~TRINITY_DN2676_c0_g1_i1.p1  ORF type:complete len:363 (-),score=0.49 TRINITY_DN2676_c0_g1_i1:36-1124(-)
MSGPTAFDPIAAPFMNETSPIAAPVAAPAGPSTALILNRVLGALYITTAAASLAMLIFFFTRKRRIEAKKMMLFQTFAFSFVRAVYCFLPVEFWSNFAREDSYRSQVFMDLLPEMLFLAIVTLLVCVWVHIYIRTRSLSRKLPKRLFWIAYLAIYGLFVIGVMILFIVITTTPKEDLTYAEISKWEGIYICVVAALLLAGALAFGISLLVFFKRMRILSAELQSRTKKTSALVFFAIISMLVKSIFILTLNTVLMQLRRDGVLTRQNFLVIWFFYLVVTEIAPAVLVIALFSSFKKRGKKFFKGVGGDEANKQELLGASERSEDYSNLPTTASGLSEASTYDLPSDESLPRSSLRIGMARNK